MAVKIRQQWPLTPYCPKCYPFHNRKLLQLPPFLQRFRRSVNFCDLISTPGTDRYGSSVGRPQVSCFLLFLSWSLVACVRGVASLACVWRVSHLHVLHTCTAYELLVLLVQCV